MIQELEGRMISEPGRVTIVEVSKQDLQKLINNFNGIMFKVKEGWYAYLERQWFLLLLQEDG